MAFQTDVKATAPLTSTGAFTDAAAVAIGRCRLKGFYAVSGASAGTVVITNGNGGATLLNIATPTAANNGSFGMTLPGEGILVETSLYGTVTNTSSIVLFFG